MPGGMQGVPMVARSPLHHHESGLQHIESFHHQSWKRIPDFSTTQQDEINHNAFTSLVIKITNKLTCYDLVVKFYCNLVRTDCLVRYYKSIKTLKLIPHHTFFILMAGDWLLYSGC